MKILILWSVLLLVFGVSQLLIWRCCQACQSKKTLIGLSVIVSLLLFYFNTSWIEKIQIALAYYSVVLSYLIFYLWLELDSPSLRLLHYIGQANPTGVSRPEIATLLQVENPVQQRLSLLEVDGLVQYHDPNYHLTPKGKTLARLFQGLANRFHLPLEG